MFFFLIGGVVMMVMGKMIMTKQNPLQVISGNDGVCPDGACPLVVPRRLTCQYQISVNGDAKLCYWGCMLG